MASRFRTEIRAGPSRYGQRCCKRGSAESRLSPHDTKIQTRFSSRFQPSSLTCSLLPRKMQKCRGVMPAILLSMVAPSSRTLSTPLR